MMDWYYETSKEMEAWMKHSKEAIYDVRLEAPLPLLEKTQNFTTVAKDGTYYNLPDKDREIVINNLEKPSSVTLLRTGTTPEYNFDKGSLTLELAEELTTPLPDLVKILF